VLRDLDMRSRLSLVEVHQSGGIDDGELGSTPIRDAIHAISGRAGLVLDDSSSFPDQSIEEGGFADVRPTDDRNYRSGHILTVSSH
jgi:hypothetical protein